MFGTFTWHGFLRIRRADVPDWSTLLALEQARINDSVHDAHQGKDDKPIQNVVGVKVFRVSIMVHINSTDTDEEHIH